VIWQVLLVHGDFQPCPAHRCRRTLRTGATDLDATPGAGQLASAIEKGGAQSRDRIE